MLKLFAGSSDDSLTPPRFRDTIFKFGVATGLFSIKPVAGLADSGVGSRFEALRAEIRWQVAE
jgi:hypothetical protein